MKNIYLYTFLVFVTIITTLLLNEYVYTEEYYYFTLHENFNDDQIQNLITKKEKVQWVVFVEHPLKILLKTFVVALMITFGLNLYNQKLKFSSVLTISLYSETIFLLPPLVRFIWFSFHSSYTIEEVVNFPTFSLFDIMGKDNANAWLTYSLKTISLFEIIYILLLVNLLSKEIKSTFSKALMIILSSYGLGLVLWIVVVSFIMITFGA